MARSFREAEEASNAQGISQAAVTWALENAKKNPTPENIAIAKDTYAAQQAIAPKDTQTQNVAKALQDTIASLPKTYQDVTKTIEETNRNIGEVNRLGEIAGNIAVNMGGQPWQTVNQIPVTNKSIEDYTDAFALLEDTFRRYGLESLVPKIREYMTQNMGPNQATLLLKQTPEYQARFSGNEARRKAGKNVYDEGTYLALENRYRELMSAYGQDKYATQAEFSNLIANDVAPTELNERLDIAVNQVKNADPNILANLKLFYPSISDTDLVGYFLKPDQALVDLQQKVTASEIGAAAQEQKLAPLTTARMLELQGLGITQEAARTGFQKVATVLPESKKLSDIYGEAKIDYTQRTAEEEMLQGTASAARKRRQLQQLETAAFSGSSGTDIAQGSSLGKSLQGKF